MIPAKHARSPLFFPLPFAIVTGAAIAALVSPMTAAIAGPSAGVEPNARADGAAPGAQRGRCAQCHAEIASEWQSSLHRASHDDASYLASLPGEPTAFCNSCHAPVPARADVGIDCVTCHGTPHEGSPATTATAAAASCARCHEFDFPHRGPLPATTGSSAPGETDVPLARQMQRTITEHSASPAHDVPCTSCHMPAVPAADGRSRPHVSHRFAASRDADALRGAVRVSARPTEMGAIAIDLQTVGTGHAFPTGDMFRRLVVRAEAVDPAGAIVGRTERTLQRNFVVASGGLREGADTRLPASGSVVTVDLDLGENAVDARIRWSVDYERITNGFRHPLEVRGRVTLASGTTAAGGSP